MALMIWIGRRDGFSLRSTSRLPQPLNLLRAHGPHPI